MEWWVTTGDRAPIGPVSTELLLRGLDAGEVPKDALVCEVGGTTWKMIGSVPEFHHAFGRHRARPTLEHTTSPDAFEGTGPSKSAPPPLQRFGDETDRTIVEPPPFPPSEPPLEYVDEAEDQRATVRPVQSPDEPE